MWSKHRHVGCLSRGNGLQCWRIVLRFNFAWAYLEKEPLTAKSQSALWDKANRGCFSSYAHPKYNLSTIRQHCRPLPLDRHPTCLFLDPKNFSILVDPGLQAQTLPNEAPPVQPCPRLVVTIDFMPILAILHFISPQILSGECQNKMTFFWSCKIGSGLDRLLRELQDWYILICLRLSDSQKSEVTGFFETERKILSFIYVYDSTKIV